MLQQQSTQPFQSCVQCAKKQQVLQKFTQLVQLLKKKTQRGDDSRMKASINCQLNSIHPTHHHNLAILKFVLAIEKHSFKNMLISFKTVQAKAADLALGLSPESAIIKPLKDKQLFKHASVASSQSPKMDCHQKPHKQEKFPHSIENQPQFLEKIQIKSSPKFLLKKIFELTHENQLLQLKLKNISTNLQENIRRQEKQIAKKRQSLQGLADDLSEKNQVIDELKETIKSLESKLGTKDNLVLHRLLQEDSESLRRTILKLENANEKLNHQIFKVRGEKANLEKQGKQLSKTIQSLKSEISTLKQSMFQTEQMAQQNWLKRRELEIVSKKVERKLQKLKRMQKKCNQANRGKDSISTHPDQLTISKSERKVETTLNSLQKTEEERVSQLENKLESLFTFLFHLQNQNYQLHSAELFDEEQKELLLTHQHRFIANMRAHDLHSIQPVSKRRLQSNMETISLGESLLEAFQEGPAPEKQVEKPTNIKLIQFEIQRSKLIEKISEVKERELHTRCVILQLLKSLELKSIKKDTEAIVILLCELFEYSEQERQAILQPKSKKFFGIL